MRRWLLALLCALLLLLGASPAFAHAALLATDPEDGTVATSLGEIRPGS